MFWASTIVDDLKRKKVTIEGNQGELAKDPPTIKSVFSLEHKGSEWMNSSVYLGWIRLDPFYREFGMSLLVRRH